MNKLNERKPAMKTIQAELQEGQAQAILKLIDDEMELNQANGDGSYNTYWDPIRKALGYVD